MNLSIQPHAVQRVQEAVARRKQLLRMYAHEMPRDFSEELAALDRTIASAVSVSLPR